MAGHMPLYGEDVDIITGHLRAAGKLTSADLVQDMFEEMKRLYKLLGKAAVEAST